MDILQAMGDRQVFGAHFPDPKSWCAWQAFLAGLFGLPLSPSQAELFAQCSGERTPPAGGAQEAWLICGRRSGKSFILSTIAVYLACFKDWRLYLTAGERATIMIIAADRKQSRVIMGYVKGLLQSVPMLAATIESETAESIALRGRVTIEIHTASFKTTRGYTVAAALLDEIAFWPTDEFAADPRGGDQRAQARHGNDPGRDVAVCFLALRAQGRVVARLRKAIRQKESRAGVAGADARHELHGAASVDRRCLAGGPRGCWRRMAGDLPRRS
jgi:hypothetical protein